MEGLILNRQTTPLRQDEESFVNKSPHNTTGTVVRQSSNWLHRSFNICTSMIYERDNVWNSLSASFCLPLYRWFVMLSSRRVKGLYASQIGIEHVREFFPSKGINSAACNNIDIVSLMFFVNFFVFFDPYHGDRICNKETIRRTTKNI